MGQPSEALRLLSTLGIYFVDLHARIDRVREGRPHGCQPVCIFEEDDGAFILDELGKKKKKRELLLAKNALP
jgi:hypothetical protein